MKSLNRYCNGQNGNLFFSRLQASALFLCLPVMCALLACTEDSGSNNVELSQLFEKKHFDVKSFDDLNDCNDSLDRATAFVEDESASYVCFAGDWIFESDGNSSNHKKYSSSTNTSKYSSSSSSRGSSSSLSKSVDVFNPRISYEELKDARDGQKYKIVKIGSQIWMAENLRFEGENIKDGENSWCYDNKPENCEKYGRLYTWATAMDSTQDGDCGYGVTCTITEPHQGICPDGWHVPTNDEYNMLYEYVGGKIIAPLMLKSSDIWGYYNGSNEYGFSLIPGGYRNIDGEFIRMGEHANLWSATETEKMYAIDQFFDGYNRINQNEYNKTDGHNIRCLSDESALPQSSSSEVSSSSEKPSSSIESSSSSIVYGTLEDERDGQSYKTVEIGDQVWMAENLRFVGENIKEGENSWCYDNKPENCEKYGRLYTWATAMDSTQEGDCGYGVTCTITEPHQGICPDGWHVPTNDEFNTLYEYVGGVDVAPQMLKSKTGWDNYNGIDAYGFNLLPGGFYNPKDEFIRIGEHANIWSATETSTARVIDQYFDGYDSIVYEEYTKTDGHSVRCLQD